MRKVLEAVVAMSGSVMTQPPATARVPRVDPLVLLREHTVAKKRVQWLEDHLEFEGTRVHRSAKCGYRTAPRDPLMDIGSVWYMLREISADRSYTQDAVKKRGFRYIGVASRGDLCDYLAGHSSSCTGLVADVIEGRKRPRDDADGEAARAKRSKAASRVSAEQPSIAHSSAITTDISHSDVAVRVRMVRDLDVLVRCPGRTVPNADLILKIAQDEWKNWHDRVDRTHEVPFAGKVPLAYELEEILRQDKKRCPIILVPCNKNAPVNLLNVQDLLQHGLYKKTNEERLRFFESTRPEVVEVQRNVNGKLWTFQVRDSAKNFTKEQWLRTVCIVSDGSDWQFKGWPFESVVDMFSTVQGVFFAAAGVPVPLHVHMWAAAVIQLSPLHLDHRFSNVRDNFFMEIEAFMNKSRIRKFVNHTTLEGGKRIIIKPKPIL